MANRSRARRAERRTWHAADLLEEVIDDHLRKHAAELLPPRVLAFPLAPGTDRGIVDEIIARYRGVGWTVELVSSGSDEALGFKLPRGA